MQSGIPDSRFWGCYWVGSTLRAVFACYARGRTTEARGHALVEDDGLVGREEAGCGDHVGEGAEPGTAGREAAEFHGLLPAENKAVLAALLGGRVDDLVRVNELQAKKRGLGAAGAIHQLATAGLAEFVPPEIGVQAVLADCCSVSA